VLLQSTPCTGAGQSELNNPGQGNFITSHLGDATAVANSLGTSPENILGLSALESGWGVGNFADHNNFFGQHAPQPGQIGSFTTAKDSPGATFSSYSASAQAFAQQYGSIVQGITDPSAFAAALQNSGKFGVNQNGTPVPSYVGSTAATIRGIARAAACIHQGS
jgi:flagellum-specific peptidoglycan hydrolase FlgJ